MKHATLKTRHLARRLIAHEPRGNKSAAPMPATFEAVDKLRPHLTTLLGNAGYRALLARALALAGAEAGWLRAVQVKADGTLEGLDELTQTNPPELASGRIALLTQLLALLVAFIGEKLTLQLVREAWANLPAADLNFDEGA